MSIRIRHYLMATLVGALFFGWSGVQAAEIPTPPELMEKYGLQPGMKITKENADLIKDLVPDAVYQRTKNGDYVFRIGKFDPPDVLSKVWDKDVYDSIERNVDKFDVDADGGIIEKVTKQRPWPMPLGLPYSKIDFAESPEKIGSKMVWNVVSLAGACGEQDHDGSRLLSMPRTGSHDRYISLQAIRQYVDFRRTPVESSRPVIFQEIFFFREPADAFGSANLTWRWSDPKKWDSVWSYSPSTRRVRRQTAANRSDATLGTEFTQDDGTPLYNGKVEMMEWKYIGKGAALLPVTPSEDQAPGDHVAKITYNAIHSQSSAYANSPGAYQQRYKKLTLGSQQDPQQYASWWVPDMLWVPVPVYIVEAQPKDPYYNYGRQIFFFEQNTFIPVWKQIYNRSGEYWRTASLWVEFPRFQANGKETVCMDGVGLFMTDEKTNRTTVASDTGDNILGQSGGPSVNYNTGLEGSIFDLDRFLQYGK